MCAESRTQVTAGARCLDGPTARPVAASARRGAFLHLMGRVIWARCPKIMIGLFSTSVPEAPGAFKEEVLWRRSWEESCSI